MFPLHYCKNLRLGYSHLFKFSRPRTSYIILLPETLPETVESNAIAHRSSLPSFNCFTSELAYNAVGKAALDYETGFWTLEEKLKDSNTPKTFSTVIEKIDELDAPLSSAVNCVQVMHLTQNNEFTSEMLTAVSERSIRSIIHKFQSVDIYKACKEVKATEPNLSEIQHRILDKYLLEGRLNGIELPPKVLSTLRGNLTKLEEIKKGFQSKIAKSTNRFTLKITDKKIVSEFPEHLLRDMCEESSDPSNGPWVASLLPHVYPEFMKYCPDREVRENMFRGFVMRGSNKLSRDFNTNEDIGEIRRFRRQQAKLLGYENFAQMMMETKMADTTENVLSMIDSLLVNAKKSQSKELNSLQNFAEDRGFQENLEAHDIPYWRHRQKRELHNLSENELKEYFPFEHVWGQLLMLCSQLFDVSFEEVHPDYDNTWHPDVRLFNVLDSNGMIISQFYLDPYARPGEKLNTFHESAWTIALNNKSISADQNPLSVLVFNFEPPHVSGTPSLLTFHQVSLLFQKFGSALQHLLTTVPYGDASGQRNIEWDCVDVCSNFMENWLYEPNFLERISQHYDSELPLSGATIQDIIFSRSHLAGYDLCRELYLSHLDLNLYIKKDYWEDAVKDIWEKYQPFPLKKYDHHLCSLTPLLTDVTAAGYYSSTWSKMIAANCFNMFKEAESDDEFSRIGNRFRNTYLSLGGGCHSYEVFRRFAGKDPSPEILNVVLKIDGAT